MAPRYHISESELYNTDCSDYRHLL